MRTALDSRVGVKFSAHHPITSWLIEHAGDTLTKYHVGQDGRTAYERLKGKKFSRETCELGERIWYRLGKPSAHKLEPRWCEGVFLGWCWRPGAAKVGTDSGVLRAHGIRRVPVEGRWRRDLVEAVCGVPWNMKPTEVDPEIRQLARMMHPDEVTKEADARVLEGARTVSLEIEARRFFESRVHERVPWMSGYSTRRTRSGT